ncbi:MAG: hypothetical protein K2P81_15310 [Bacteriovoracaceae bacterium]|nr:hypothetical protein [Bacteriovoracaceae bacterium]
MKKHLPSLQESLEIIALSLIVIGLQFFLQSWGWTILFSVGFIWNWAVLNGWVAQRTQEKKYRFSVLRAISVFHHSILYPFKNYPKIRNILAVLPAAIAVSLGAYLLESNIPWWAVLLGSLAFILVRFQITTIRQKL